MALPTLLDIAKKNGSDAVVGLIDEASKAHPEITMGFARTIKGRQYRTLVRTAVPVGGSFRDANNGVDPSKGTYANKLVETFIMDKRWECDKAVADSDEDGPEAFISLEASAVMEGGMQDLATQFYYGRVTGNGGDTSGYPGLIDAYDSTNMVIDAGGTTAATGSSVWLVKFGPKDVGWVWGQNGELAMSDVRIETITGQNSKKLTGYVQNLLAYPGVQVGSTYSVVRIKKLTADSGKGLTDARLFAALALFKVGTVPDVVFMTKRSQEQLRASRTATNATGAPAPIPTDIAGIPIHPTEAISNAEALTL